MKYFLPIILVLLALLFVWMTYTALSDLHSKGALPNSTTVNQSSEE